MEFNIPSDMLDEIQVNIESLINGFDIPDDNKLDVIKKINFMYTRTKQMTLVDPLTGLYNRRHFDKCFEREFMRAKRYGNALSIAVIDVDFFKNINDTHGHSFGDFVLREIAYLATSTVRTTDMIFRYGGEEFAIIFTETDRDSAIIPLERLRQIIEEHNFRFNNNEIKVTISIGVSSDTQAETPQQMFDNADRALYKAKEDGRNRIIVE